MNIKCESHCLNRVSVTQGVELRTDHVPRNDERKGTNMIENAFDSEDIWNKEKSNWD